MKPGSDMPCHCASSLTDWLLSPSESSTRRRVESESAENKASNAGSDN